MAKTKKEEESKMEGPRSFARFLELLDRGDAHALVSAELHRITDMCSTEAKHRDAKVKGKVKLEIHLEVDPGGHAEVFYKVATQEPIRKTGGSLFYLTRDNNLSKEAPTQEPLKFRDVKADEKHKDATGDSSAAAQE